MRFNLSAMVSIPALAAITVGLAGCDKSGPGAPQSKPAGPPSVAIKSMFGPAAVEFVSAKNPSSPAKIALGRMLYYDARVSADGKISCNSCHKLDKYGVDNLPTSPGHDGMLGTRNSPTVYNAAGQVAQFWDGRAEDVEAQAKGPMLNPAEHGMKDSGQVVQILKGIPGYAPLFAAAFPSDADPVTFDNFALAIGAFERKLVTRGKWDRWITGEGSALSAEEKAGLDAFIEVGCTTCHVGAYLGGSTYMKMGTVVPYPTTDLGRYEVTKNEADKYAFKVPGLRNVAETGPYLHDGSIASLDEVVKLMAKHQLGKDLTPTQVTDIVTFLKALTGKIPDEYIKMPQLPGAQAEAKQPT